jgi:hypothetical protein
MTLQLVDDWRLFWRRWSTWLSAAYAVATPLMLSNAGTLLGLLGYLPEGIKQFVAGALMVTLFAIPVLVVNLRQPKLEEARVASAD